MSTFIQKSIADFSMNQVTNLNPYCVNALEKDLAYLLAFNPDRLLAGFRETAGLDTHGVERYEGWESTLIGGHTLGHYLSAIAQAYANPGVNPADQKALYQMMTTLIDGLLECQAHSKGKKNFLFGAIIIDPENVEIQFDNIEKDLTNIMTQAWVPWYNLHKLLAGVLDTYKFTAYAPALTLAKQIGDWSYQRAMGWDATTAAQVIRVEYGGMNEALYQLYAITGDEKYAVVAHYFDAEMLFESILSGGDNALNNLHANTTIPKFIGAMYRYITCHGKCIQDQQVDASRYLAYATAFWNMVVEKHTYVTGGNSEWEHFGKDYILDKERTNCNCETCNIYNMLKFSRALFCITGDVKYLQYYEAAFYNTILSSQNPETGMTTYFQPMSTGYFKVFGQRFDKFWCCTGTGMENFTKLNDGIFFRNDSQLIVNLYESAKLSWIEKKLEVEQTANLQTTDQISLRVKTMDQLPTVVEIALRIPAWVKDAPSIWINQVPYSYETDNGFILLPAGLASESEIIIKLPMGITISALPDQKRSIAFSYGPFVLSANLGTEDMKTTTTGVIVTIPASKIRGYDNLILPDTIAPEDFLSNPEQYMKKNPATPDVPLSFTLTINELSFAPHFSRYKERYGIYFTVCTQEELDIAAREKALQTTDFPEGEVIDTVQPGYGQYENDALHRMIDWGGSVGSTDHGTSRYAKAGGSFTYHMCVSMASQNYLSITIPKEDSGMTLKIQSGDDVFFEDIVAYSGTEETFEIRVKVPMSIAQTAETINVNGEEHHMIPLTFKGSEGTQSARLFGFVYMMNY